MIISCQNEDALSARLDAVTSELVWKFRHGESFSRGDGSPVIFTVPVQNKMRCHPDGRMNKYNGKIEYHAFPLHTDVSALYDSPVQGMFDNFEKYANNDRPTWDIPSLYVHPDRLRKRHEGSKIHTLETSFLQWLCGLHAIVVLVDPSVGTVWRAPGNCVIFLTPKGQGRRADVEKAMNESKHHFKVYVDSMDIYCFPHYLGSNGLKNYVPPTWYALCPNPYAEYFPFPFIEKYMDDQTIYMSYRRKDGDQYATLPYFPPYYVYDPQFLASICGYEWDSFFLLSSANIRHEGRVTPSSTSPFVSYLVNYPSDGEWKDGLYSKGNTIYDIASHAVYGSKLFFINQRAIQLGKRGPQLSLDPTQWEVRWYGCAPIPKVELDVENGITSFIGAIQEQARLSTDDRCLAYIPDLTVPGREILGVLRGSVEPCPIRTVPNPHTGEPLNIISPGEGWPRPFFLVRNISHLYHVQFDLLHKFASMSLHRTIKTSYERNKVRDDGKGHGGTVNDTRTQLHTLMAILGDSPLIGEHDEWGGCITPQDLSIRSGLTPDMIKVLLWGRDDVLYFAPGTAYVMRKRDDSVIDDVDRLLDSNKRAYYCLLGRVSLLIGGYSVQTLWRIWTQKEKIVVESHEADDIAAFFNDQGMPARVQRLACGRKVELKRAVFQYI